MDHNHSRLFLHFTFLKNVKLIELYITMALTSLAFSLIGIFIPIYLLHELGYGFDVVMYFLLISSVSQIIIYPAVLKLTSWFGLNKILILSVPIRVGYLLMLKALETTTISLTLIAFVGMLGTAMFWFPYHRRFIEATDSKRRGSELGLRYALSALFAILGPLLGGFVVTMFGFDALYIAVIVILILSVIPSHPSS